MLLIVTLLSLSITAVAIAKGKPKVIVNGGGIAVNKNSGIGDLLSAGGFTAKVNGLTAKGQIQSKFVFATDLTTFMESISSLHIA